MVGGVVARGGLRTEGFDVTRAKFIGEASERETSLRGEINSGGIMPSSVDPTVPHPPDSEGQWGWRADREGKMCVTEDAAHANVRG